MVNAVTIETQALLIRHLGLRGGDLTSIAVARADQVGRSTAGVPAMPVTQWAVAKP